MGDPRAPPPESGSAQELGYDHTSYTFYIVLPTYILLSAARLVLARLNILLTPKCHATAARGRTPPSTSSTGRTSESACATLHLLGQQFPKVVTGTERVTTKFYNSIFCYTIRFYITVVYRRRRPTTTMSCSLQEVEGQPIT